jgi:hypothetical protein
VSRRRLLVALVAGMLALGVSAWQLWPRSAITRENAVKIHVGMTLAEAEAILGGPARDESTGPCYPDVSGTEDGDEMKLELQSLLIQIRPGLQWRSNSVVIWVKEDQVGQDRRLTEVRYVPMQRGEESLLEMLRRWFGR